MAWQTVEEVVKEFESDIADGKIRKVDFTEEELKQKILTRKRFTICVNNCVVLYFYRKQFCGQDYIIYGNYDDTICSFYLKDLDKNDEIHYILDKVWELADEYENLSDDALGNSYNPEIHNQYSWYISN